MRIPTLFGGLFVVVVSVSAAISQESLQWEDNFNAATAKAAASNRLVFVEFTAPWCGVCQKVHREVLSRPDVESRLGSGFVPVKVNVDHYPNLGKQFGITGLPTVAIVTPDGRCLQKRRGAFTRDQLMTILATYEPKQRVAGGVATPASMGTIPPSQRYGTPQPAQRPAVPPYEAASTNPSQPSPAAPQGRYANPYNGPYHESSSPQDGSASTRRGPMIPDPSFRSSVPSQPASSQPAMPPVQPNRYGNQAPANQAPANQAPANQAPANQANPSPYGGIASQPARPPMQPTAPPQRPAAPPVAPQNPYVANHAPPATEPVFALDGRCPVTLMESRVWEKGDRRWGARHEGHVYLFTGAAEQQRFLADPDRYSPVCSGLDVVLFVDRGEQKAGSREHGVFFGDRVYLFSSEESLRQFSSAPHRYASAMTKGLGRKADLPKRTTYR